MTCFLYGVAHYYAQSSRCFCLEKCSFLKIYKEYISLIKVVLGLFSLMAYSMTRCIF
jgi:hypothetical protein